ncbi:MAG TPA: acetoacetate--CoA ligase [Steroidobacteraceae bacterium]|nr:acetoacetate--CoA ligase [Steroidobacteraceae bacterium]
MSELWRPSAERIANANLTRFMRCVTARTGTPLTDYDTTYAWSLEQPAQFWTELARFADVRGDFGAGPVIEHPTQMPGARFFPAARLNFAENLLKFADDREALVFRNERGTRRALSGRELRAEVARIAAGLIAAGVIAGDRVAGYLPNLPEAAIAMLATASIGAVWSSCSPDFGVHGVLDRFGQIAPKVLFTADGYFYAGKTLDSLGPIAEVLGKLSHIERVVVIPYVAAQPELARLGAASARASHWTEFGTRGTPLRFARQPFNHPLYILYSSGTTGVPKCIVHGAGGTLLQHQKEHLLHTDLAPHDRLFYFTTCGWMMWNWLMSALATGATLILYDGNPFHPDPGVLWRMAAEERLSVFGTSAKYLASLEQSEFVPARAVDLTALRTLLSTGSPLLPDGFDFVYRSIKADLELASISGGTDIVSCFALGCPIRPVYRGEIQCRGLGMAVDIFDDQGRPLRGTRGELVCTAPFPSMPIHFWNDPDGSRYRAAYFERFPGVWHHGDFAAITRHDGLVIYGRSDAVLNPGGVRIGTAEIYGAVEALPQIAESLAVGQDWQGDVRVVLFVRLKPGVELTEELRQQIRSSIRTQTTARHVPARIIAVPDIPRTLSGKLTELAVRNVIHGLPVKNVDALANPQALEHFRNLPELAS